MLLVKRLYPNALLPTVVHPGEDLGYDLFALEDTTIQPFSVNKVRTGISAMYYEYTKFYNVGVAAIGEKTPYGLLIRDRSSMALSGLFVVGGVIDYGYRGEIIVLMRSSGNVLIDLKAGEKIAQMIPLPVLTHGTIEEVEELPLANRGAKGFGSSGV